MRLAGADYIISSGNLKIRNQTDNYLLYAEPLLESAYCNLAQPHNHVQIEGTCRFMQYVADNDRWGELHEALTAFRRRAQASYLAVDNFLREMDLCG